MIHRATSISEFVTRICIRHGIAPSTAAVCTEADTSTAILDIWRLLGVLTARAGQGVLDARGSAQRLSERRSAESVCE
jgi:hypothetical protein